MCFISIHSVLNTLSECTSFYISKSITSHTFLLVFKIVKSLQCILKLYVLQKAFVCESHTPTLKSSRSVIKRPTDSTTGTTSGQTDTTSGRTSTIIRQYYEWTNEWIDEYYAKSLFVMIISAQINYII